ncbi:MAG TPA: hypothetical protein VNS19_17565 [Acidimicrobiales bacterium]|nr:hypothetical protein [Acidimicrobiales bacterium]
MRRVGREEWKRIASLVLVAVIATFSLPLGVSAFATQPVDATPAQRAHFKRLHVEARPVATNRRSMVQRDVALPSSSFLVAALAVVGLLVLARSVRPPWTPALLAVQRGPPSSR